jgi:Zn-dependent peptidase ImmA (M78 family)
VAIAADPADDPENVGARIREALGISWETQMGWRDPQAAWRHWRAAIERVGVLVFQAGDIDVKEMRGTSIPEGPLPVILINSADSPHGKIFTLVHEFAHVLLFNGGHRTSTMEGKQWPEDQILERASNRFAAATLMPREKFLAELSRYGGATEGDEDALRRFSQRIKVSPEAILRRLLTLRRVPVSLYRQKRRGWTERSWYQFSGAGGPIPIETRVLSSAGRGFVSLVVDGYQRNAVSSSDVSDYLGIQLKFLSKITDALTPAPGSLGAR